MSARAPAPDLDAGAEVAPAEPPAGAASQPAPEPAPTVAVDAAPAPTAAVDAAPAVDAPPADPGAP